MAGHTAVRINNDLASGKAAIAHWTTNDELSGWVYVVLRIWGKPGSGQNGLDDFSFDEFS
jgi:hypothetical protein